MSGGELRSPAENLRAQNPRGINFFARLYRQRCALIGCVDRVLMKLKSTDERRKTKLSTKTFEAVIQSHTLFVSASHQERVSSDDS